MKKRSLTTTGEWSGGVPGAYQKRLSLDSAKLTAEKNKKLIFYGLSRGEEYTPVNSSSGRLIPIHGIGKLIVDGKVRYAEDYVVLRFKYLRFAKELKLNSYYEFTTFFCESYEPTMMPRGAQTNLHFYVLAQFNLTEGLYKELDGHPFATHPPDGIITTLGAIHVFFEEADPSKYGRDNKPLVNSTFKIISENADTVVGGGLVKSSWRLSDGADTIGFSIVGDNRSRFSFVVGNVYKAFGMNLFYNGNGPAVMQPTGWAHVESCSSADVFQDVQTIASVNETTKHFVFTMVKFLKMQMQCPSSGCLKLIDVGKKAKLMTCSACRCSFRIDAKKYRVDVALNGVEMEPITTTTGGTSVVTGPVVENLRLFKIDLVKVLFNVEQPEAVFEKPKALQKASMAAMKKIFKVTYDSETLTILNLAKFDGPTEGLFSDDDEDEDSLDDNNEGNVADVDEGEKEEPSTSAKKTIKSKKRSSSKYKAKRHRRYEKGKKQEKRSKDRRHKRRRSPSSSSSSSSDQSLSSKSVVESDDSQSSGHVALADRVAEKKRREEKSSGEKKKEGNKGAVEAEDKKNEEEEKEAEAVEKLGENE